MSQVVNQQHRQHLARLEQAMIATGKTIDLPVSHYFAHGTYVRELFIPAGTVLTGKIHRYSCVNVLSSGCVKVITDEGEATIRAPHTFVTGGNVKKAIAALEDSTFLNIHPWDGKMNLAELENYLIISEQEQQS